jgi:hypothetical protein
VGCGVFGGKDGGRGGWWFWGWVGSRHGRVRVDEDELERMSWRG